MSGSTFGCEIVFHFYFLHLVYSMFVHQDDNVELTVDENNNENESVAESEVEDLSTNSEEECTSDEGHMSL